MRVPIEWSVRASIALRDMDEAEALSAARSGPFVVLPEMDPLPVPPADDAVLETETPSVPLLVRSEELRELMRQMNANELR